MWLDLRKALLSHRLCTQHLVFHSVTDAATSKNTFNVLHWLNRTQRSTSDERKIKNKRYLTETPLPLDIEDTRDSFKFWICENSVGCRANCSDSDFTNPRSSHNILKGVNCYSSRLVTLTLPRMSVCKTMFSVGSIGISVL